MKVGEFARRARASRLAKKAKLEEAFERARRDAQLMNVTSAFALPSAWDSVKRDEFLIKSEDQI